MSLLKQIQADQLAARKNKDSIRANLLTTLLGEATRIGKDDGNRESNDLEVTQTIKKFVKNAQDTLQHVYKTGDVVTIQFIKDELAILENYLPKQLDEVELRSIIETFINSLPEKSPKQMGIVMKNLTVNHAGTYDGQLASKLVKELLSK